MATINSVLGPVDTRDLGFTLSHEHMWVTAAGISQTYPEFLDLEAAKDGAVKDLKAAYDEAGLRTYVDMTTFDIGRDVVALEEVSRRTGLQIIATAGFHRTIPRVFWMASPDAVAALFVREIEEGIDGTEIKAGVLKAAGGTGRLSEQEEIVHRAVARAHLRTGVPIFTHTEQPDGIGLEQIRVFQEEGVDLNRVLIGHANDSTDVDYLQRMLDKGVWLGLDRYPGGRWAGSADWEQRTATAKNLIDAGYADRLTISHDHANSQCRPSLADREIRDRNNPDGYLFITRQVLPRLRELGTNEADIHKLTVDNPRRLFEGS